MSEDFLVAVARLGRTHGTRGQLRAWPLPGSSGAWTEACRVFVGPAAGEAREFELLAVKPAGRAYLVSLGGIEDRDAAACLVNQTLFVARSDLPECEPGCYYVADLIGMKVFDTRGRELGRLFDVFATAAHEVYVVRGQLGELLLPVVDGVVVEVDCRARRLVVDPPPGLPGLGQ